MSDTAAVIDQFNAAFLERAPEKLVDLIAPDCVIEGTSPAPDGNVWAGYEECVAGWLGLASDPTIQFEASRDSFAEERISGTQRQARQGHHPTRIGAS